MLRYPRAGVGRRLLRAALVVALLSTLLLKSGAAGEAQTTSTFPVAVQSPEPAAAASPVSAGLESWDSGMMYVQYQFGVVPDRCAAETTDASLQATTVSASWRLDAHVSTTHSTEGYYTNGAILLGPEAVGAIEVRTAAAPPMAAPLQASPLRGCATDIFSPADIHWGAVYNVTLAPHETILVTADPPRVIEAPTAAASDNPLFVIRVWDPASQEGLMVPLGESYQPTVQANAAFNVAQAAQDNLTCLAAGLVVIAGTATTWHSHRWKDWHLPVPWPLLGFFTRLRASRLLEHKARRLIHDVAEANAGIRFGDLRERTGLAVGVLTHHLTILEDHGLLRSVYRGRQRHVYPAAAKAEGAALTDTQRAVLRLVQQRVNTQAEIARRLGLSQQAVSYTLRRLRELGFLGTGPRASTDEPDPNASGAGVRPLFDPKVLLARPNLRGALQL